MRIIHEKSLYKKIKEIGILPLSITLFLFLAFPVILYMVFTRQNVRQNAETNKTATIKISPPSASYNVGQQFSVNLIIDGGGQLFNSAQATITVSPNLIIRSLEILPIGSGGCNFTFVKSSRTPTALDPSFAGGILNAASPGCTLYTLTLEAGSVGAGTISLTKAMVKAYTNSGEILLSSENGTYTISTPTAPTPTTPPVPTPTTLPTPTTVPPTPTLTPIPTLTPTPIALDTPSANLPSSTYQNPIPISGTKSPLITQVFVNNITTGVTYPSEASWQYLAPLILGSNSISIYGKDAGGNQSSTSNATIALHKLGDVSGDNIIDLIDLSMFATDWENTGALNYALSDMNNDGVVDLTDFSIFAKSYGN